ncbi:TetR family transcriptional regulator (plasmid) [Embleya sp. NBC_00888]|uniref:TetR/AcrR family transcriptional regulator n=1 Tax=Embleya sp. NBC_00888 TaxID=2975960 RepID=UPI002F90D01B|nr:TetR family transcriptional regulator [Embleya sp. NBC_00888]
MPNPEKRYAKGARRREELLRAALEVLAEEGMAGLTHRAVTERAGCPATSVAYFFGSIEQLGIEVVQLVADDLNAHLDAGAQQVGADGAGPEGIAAEFARLLTTYPQSLELARYEVLLHAARTPTHSEALVSIVETIERVAEAALRAAGALRPQEGARAFAALAEGFNLHHLVRPRSDDVETARTAFLALFMAYAMDDDELASWKQRLKAKPSARPDR